MNPFPVKRSIKPKKKPSIYLVRPVNAEWEVSNGSAKFKAGSIQDAFKAMFEWETETAAALRTAKRAPRSTSVDITKDVGKIDIPQKVGRKKAIEKPTVKKSKKPAKKRRK